MKCDVTPCGKDAVVLVYFKTHQNPFPYCADHGLERGKARNRFGRMQGSGSARRWVTAVRHEQHVARK